jgi:tetratricopeptide (TPR) repeat protein
MMDESPFADPRYLKAQHNLEQAVFYQRQGLFAQAEKSYSRVIKKNPDYFDALHFYGLFKYHQGQLNDALKLVGKAVKINPRSANAFSSLGVILGHLKRHVEALASFDAALKLEPHHVEALSNRCNSLNELGRFDDTIDSSNRAIAINPKYPEVYIPRGAALISCKRYMEALESYDQSLKLNPSLVMAWLGRGNVFSDLKRYDEAFAAYDKALTIKPDLEGAWLGRGNVFSDLKRYEEAFAAYDKALALKPDLAEAWIGRGNVFYSLNRDEEALTCYDKAISLKKDLSDGYWNKSLLKLSLGNFEEGWALYEWRWKSRYFTSPVRGFSQKLWLGNDDIAGKTILVHSEQGFGDTIQFYRYISKLKSLDCKIIFETQAPLVSLIKAQKNSCQIISQGKALPNFDVHCPLLSLPFAFKTTLATIPASIPYLAPAHEKIELWRTKLGNKSKPRIGLAWSGRLLPDFRRSMPLKLLIPIIGAAAEWHSLQKDVRESDHGSLNSSLAIIDHAASLNDFSDTAALIAELDLVISIDTAVAHLAGALGKPVLILLPFHPDFRWLRDREDSPWYPTAKLFRQTRDGDWGGVIDRILQEIKILLGTG